MKFVIRHIALVLVASALAVGAVSAPVLAGELRKVNEQR